MVAIISVSFLRTYQLFFTYSRRMPFSETIEHSQQKVTQHSKYVHRGNEYLNKIFQLSEFLWCYRSMWKNRSKYSKTTPPATVPNYEAWFIYSQMYPANRNSQIKCLKKGRKTKKSLQIQLKMIPHFFTLSFSKPDEVIFFATMINSSWLYMGDI